MKMHHLATAMLAAAAVMLPAQAMAGTKANGKSSNRLEVSNGRFPPGLAKKCDDEDHPGRKGIENACDRNAWKSRGCS